MTGICTEGESGEVTDDCIVPYPQNYALENASIFGNPFLPPQLFPLGSRLSGIQGLGESFACPPSQ
jgi:hypothetical protein